MSKELTKEQQEELQKLIDEINQEAKDVIEDYVKNPSVFESGSFHQIHENSPYLMSGSERVLTFDDFKSNKKKKD